MVSNADQRSAWGFRFPAEGFKGGNPQIRDRQIEAVAIALIPFEPGKGFLASAGVNQPFGDMRRVNVLSLTDPNSFDVGVHVVFGIGEIGKVACDPRTRPANGSPIFFFLSWRQPLDVRLEQFAQLLAALRPETFGRTVDDQGREPIFVFCHSLVKSLGKLDPIQVGYPREQGTEIFAGATKLVANSSAGIIDALDGRFGNCEEPPHELGRRTRLRSSELRDDTFPQDSQFGFELGHLAPIDKRTGTGQRDDSLGERVLQLVGTLVRGLQDLNPMPKLRITLAGFHQQLRQLCCAELGQFFGRREPCRVPLSDLLEADYAGDTD